MKRGEKSINGHYKPDIMLRRRSIQEFIEIKSVSFYVSSDISILIKTRKTSKYRKIGKVFDMDIKVF